MNLLVLVLLVTSYPSLEKHTDSTPFITAYNRKVHACGIAASQELYLDGFKAGCRVQLNVKRHLKRLDGTDYCGGLYVINDKMNFRKWKQMDVWSPTLQQALNFGVQRRVKATLLWCDKLFKG